MKRMWLALNEDDNLWLKGEAARLEAKHPGYAITPSDIIRLAVFRLRHSLNMGDFEIIHEHLRRDETK